MVTKKQPITTEPSVEDRLLAIMLSNTYTKADFKRRLRILREYIEATGFTTGGKKTTIAAWLKTKTEPIVDALAVTTWSKDIDELLHTKNIYQVAQQLEEHVHALPVVTIYLPFTPPEDEIPQIGEWARKNLDPNVLMETRIDQYVTGGCGIVWKGVYRDFSLNFIMDKKRDAVMAAINDVCNIAKNQTVLSK